MIRWLPQGRLRLALHTLRDQRPRDTAGALLLLHGLGERSPGAVPDYVNTWPGAVFALDFTGHGASSVPQGGGYACEALMLDAVAAVDTIGPCILLGRGLGAYVALMTAAVRAERVRGTVLSDGPGLAGGGDGAQTPFLPQVVATGTTTPDPHALADLATDVRHPAAAARWAQLLREAHAGPTHLHLCLREPVPWAQAVAQVLKIPAVTPLASALAACEGLFQESRLS